MFLCFKAEKLYEQRKCYPAIERNNTHNVDDVTIVKVNDCVMFRTNNDETVNVGKIKSIWIDEQNSIRLSLFRFYRLVHLLQNLSFKLENALQYIS